MPLPYLCPQCGTKLQPCHATLFCELHNASEFYCEYCDQDISFAQVVLSLTEQIVILIKIGGNK